MKRAELSLFVFTLFLASFFIVPNSEALTKYDFLNLTENTNFCTNQCYTIYNVTNPSNFDYTVNGKTAFNFSFVKNGILKSYSVLILQNVSKTRMIDNFTTTCSAFQYVENSTTFTNDNCTIYYNQYSENYTAWEYSDLNWSSSYTFKAKTSYSIRISGVKDAFASIDNILNLSLDGTNYYSFPEYAWWNSSYINSKAVNLENINSNAFVRPRILNFSTNDANRYLATAVDVVFINSTNTTVWGYELESGTNKTGNTVFWVKPDSIPSNANASAFIYYNNTLATDQSSQANTWTDYQVVLHFGENCTSGSVNCIKDSSNTANWSVLTASDPYWTSSGKFGSGYNFAGAGRINSTLTLNTDMNYTVMVWFKDFENATVTDALIGENGAQAPLRLTIVGASHQASLTFGNSGLCDIGVTGASLNDSAWHLMGLSVNGSNSAKSLKLYLDGKNIANASGNCGAQSSLIQIGGIGGANLMMGVVEELRITKEGVVYDSDTVKQIYDSFNESFVYYGSELTVSGGGSNNVPVNANITIIPTTAYTNNALNCSFNVTDDSAFINVTVAWYNGSARLTTWQYTFQNITSGTVYQNSSGGVPINVIKKNEVWKCEITSTDGTNTNITNSSSVTISNTAPTITAPTLTPSPAYKSSPNVSVVNGSNSDIDGDSLTLNYRFWKNGVLLNAFSNDTAFNSSFIRFDNLTGEFYANDGTANSSFLNSTTLSISNSLAVPSTPTLSPTAIFKTSPNVSCTNSSIADNDGDTAFTVNYRFWRDATLINAFSNNTAFNSSFYKFVNLTCEIYVDDTFGNSSFANSTKIQVQNTNATINLTYPLNNSNINIGIANFTFINWTGYDNDADNLTYYAYADNQTSSPTTLLNTTSDSRHNLTNLISGFNWFWKVIVNDGNNNASSPVFNFTPYIDKEAPIVTLFSPANGSQMTTRLVTVRYNVSDNSTANCSVAIDNTKYNWTDTATINSSDNMFLLQSLANTGSYQWNVTCTDNWGTATTSNTFIFDMNVQQGSGGPGGDGSYLAVSQQQNINLSILEFAVVPSAISSFQWINGEKTLEYLLLASKSIKECSASIVTCKIVDVNKIYISYEAKSPFYISEISDSLTVIDVNGETIIVPVKINVINIGASVQVPAFKIAGINNPLFFQNEGDYVVGLKLIPLALAGLLIIAGFWVGLRIIGV